MIRIHGAELYDPARGLMGAVQDLWVEGERLVPAPPDGTPAQLIDARGCLVAPGAVEIHTHVAGAGLNAARRLLEGEDEQLERLAPPARAAAEGYLALGYTTVFDAASPPLLARSSMADLESMAGIDRGTYTQLGDHRLLLEAVASGDAARVRDTLAWLLGVSGGYAVKLVNPGGTTAWKAGRPAPGLDDPVGLEELTPRRILAALVPAVNELGLPHPVHLHAGRLGRPGNADSFCETVRALEGRRAHLCHIQFYSYGQDRKGGYASAAEQVAACLERYPHLTSDVGQVAFGAAVALSSDTAGLDELRQATRRPWISTSLEGEGGISCLPLVYRARDAASAVQWATGLELLLRFPDPTRLFLTTDHPNGAPFQAYPQILEWLMSRPARMEAVNSCHPDGLNRTGLAGIEREYSLGEVFAMTSWGPARALGLSDRGHLGAGALADLRCYRKGARPREMFARPAWVMRRGRLVMQDGRRVEAGTGRVLVVRPQADPERSQQLDAMIAERLSLPAAQYALGPHGTAGAEEVACRSTVS